MNDGLKQRLVGAVVLLSLVVIFWPVVFSVPETANLDRSSQIPPVPDFDKFTVSEPVIPELHQSAAESMEEIAEEPEVETAIAPQPEETEEQQVADSEPDVHRLNEHNLPVSWSLQVASFNERNNAEELKLALQKLGHKAYTRSVKTSTGSATRVYIGPRFKKSDFSKDKESIDKAFAVNSMIVRFEN